MQIVIGVVLKRLIEHLVEQELASLLERTRATPQIMYHGTSADNLPRIYQLGMIPNPTKGRWKGDEDFKDTGINRPSLHSLEGSYWTDNITIATSSAIDAVQGSAGRQAIIIAQIVPQTGKADEDDVRGPIENTLKTILTPYYGNREWDLMGPMVKGAIDADPKFHEQLIKDFSEYLHNRLKTSDKMPLDKELLEDTFNATLARIMGHVDMSDLRAKYAYIESYQRQLEEKNVDWQEAKAIAKEMGEKNSQPTFDKASGERSFLNVLDRVGRRYRKSVMPKDESERYRVRTNLRVTEPVGFSGRNKIIGILVGSGRQLELAYGIVPQQFIKDYSQHWGHQFKIVDKKTGKTVHNTLKESIEKIDEDIAQRQAFAQGLKDRGLDSYERGGYGKEGTGDKIRLGRPIKQLFAQYANHKWLSTLTTVHYVPNVYILEDLLGNTTSRDELSTIVFLPNKLDLGGLGGNIGLVVEGRITLLANNMDDIVSGGGASYTKVDPKRTKMSGANKGVGKRLPADSYEKNTVLVFDEEDWDPAIDEMNDNAKNEALVDNWKPVAIVLQRPELNVGHYVVREIKELLRDLGLDIPIMTLKEAKKKF